MAAVRSLGLHEPAAVAFLVAEGLLPPDPSEDLYKWSTSVDEDSNGPVEDEIVWTKSCAVWSRAGVVKRIFRLDLEKEDIRHALLANFSAGKIKRAEASLSKVTKAADRASINNALGGSRDSSESHVDTGHQQRKHSNTKRKIDQRDGTAARPDGLQSGNVSRALVVVLKSQAHIFFLTGNSHVVPLPFEVDSVFATPRGLLFQRKVLEEEATSPLPMAPPNSFVSNLPDFRASLTLEIPSGRKSRPSLTISPAQNPGLRPRNNKQAELPRVFSLMDPHSEMGLVVTKQSSRWLHTSVNTRPSGLDVLDSADEIVYVSPRDELSGLSRSLANGPLILVVTSNINTGLYTIWTARYREDEFAPASKKKKDKRRDTGGTRSKRRSSHFGMTTGSTTPAARPSGARESFGPRGDAWNTSGLSLSQYSTDGRPDEDDLASKLGQDFGDIGVPLKTSRRVSSLLARADLASSQDRITFSDLATGSQSNSMPHGNFRQSIGAGSTRGSFGFNPRGSLPPGNGSVYSTTSSFIDAPVDRLLEELNNESLFEGFENMDLKDSASGLPEEVLLTKVESFSSKFSGPFHTPLRFKSSSRRPKIVTISPSEFGNAQDGNSAALALCLVDHEARSMTVVNLRVDRVAIPKKDGGMFTKKSKKGAASNERSLLVQASGVQHFPDVWDACKVTDGGISRLMTVRTGDYGQGVLHLQTPSGTPQAVEVPRNLMLHEAYGIYLNVPGSRRRESGVRRLMTDSLIAIVGLDHPAVRGKFDVIDSANRRHKLQIKMEPSNELVKNVFKMCRFALPDSEKAGDGILSTWWEVMKWLQGRDIDDDDLEWTAMVLVLFSMAIPFIESKPPRNSVRPTRRKKGLLRSSSGTYIDSESWEAMLDQESGSAGVVASWMNTSSWGWVVEQDAQDSELSQGAPAPSSQSTYRRNTYLTRCIALAREFLHNPQGVSVMGSEGTLPTALSFSQSLRSTALCTILVALHLLREEHKLSICDSEQSHKPLGLLAPVLAQIGGWLGWTSWTWADDTYFGTEMASMDRWEFEDTRITKLDVPDEPFAPPSIFLHLEKAWSGTTGSFFTLLNLVIGSDRSPKKGRLWQECYALTPRTLALDGFLSEVHSCSTPLDRVQLLYRWGFTKNIIETFPEGVSTPLYETILRSQIHASTSWGSALLQLIDREDLSISLGGNNSGPPPAPAPLQPAMSHEAVRDVHHIGVSALDIDATNSFEVSAEADRLSVTRLIFREDKRFIEATRLLNQSKAPVAECVPEPEWTDSDLLEAQKEVVQLVTLRTLSIPTGRAMLAFSGRLPLLTEKLPIPSFSLQCVMKPSNVTISADRASFSEEKVCWAFFHNGVSTGLAISRNSKGIDTSWILFNKPQELTNRHAGFLLALGLNGHLKSLAKWVAFKYLTPKHTMTSIGLLLGLSASYLGTMDTLITRLLSVHVTRMLPMGAAELNLSPLTQTAGIMGIGLLYCGSQHRRMSEVMLSEIENVEQEESSPAHDDLRDEGYRLAAGLALGFINLGKGKDLRGMRDMHIVERLLAVAVGTKNVDLAHILDRATAGATIALAIIFMKTNDEILAQKIDIPDTTVRFDYVRPDIFLLRTLARHLIMWDRIRPTDEWFVQSLPAGYRRRYRLRSVRRLKSDDMPFFNIVAGLCFTLGLRYAGSAQPAVRDLLLAYLDQFIRICRLPAVNYDAKLTRNSVRHCQDVVALSAAAVMAGTGDLALFRRLRSLHGRVDSDTPYGSHMSSHMALGLLFLGGGSYTLGTSDLAIASLLCSLYPIFPTTVLDNKCHLQAFRHLWVLAAEPRCLVPRDLDSRRPISLPITWTNAQGICRTVTAPCLLPDLSGLARVEIRHADYWPLVLDFAAHPDLRDKLRQGDQSVYLRRKAMTNSTGASSVFVSTLSGLSDAQDVLPSSTIATQSGKGLLVPAQVTPLSGPRPPSATAHNLWEWIFALDSLQDLGVREKALVLPQSSSAIWRRRSGIPTVELTAVPWLRPSAVDIQLVLERTVHDIIQAARGRAADADEVRDRLWQLRLLFSWLDSRAEDRMDQEGKSGSSDGLWLRRDYIEETRWKIWGVQIGDSE
ncbi:20S cyclosome subunit [Aspergillus japonicus CBS 114.51]|uniref:20S cyclosome subunit n=1 Tax=Aspergillus japonicus CBS 114.51 TaxID=1448312 RepID=A0A8T8X4F8_ASPJA|nr:20S cyclosome subunit [Aspergillus japonicus CBS 114.51]RAH83028.1 20S cyclosome subunit [Aspergillus japonicus CBS 114.51]